MAWTNRILPLIGAACALLTAQTPPGRAQIDPKLPTIFVVGDSTANNNNRRGWGDPFADYFDSSKVNVTNRARGGRSSRTFTSEGLWTGVQSALKPGDYVLLQFGHNDGGPPDKDKFRGSLQGLGEETQEVTLANGSKEVVHTFGWYMRKFIVEAKEKGAIPIVLSPTIRNIWKDGKVETHLGSYGEWSESVAKSAGVAYFDLSKEISERYQEMGPEKVGALFPEDHTHTTPEGADLNASMVVAGLKSLPNTPFARWFNAKGQTVEPYPSPVSTNGGRLNLPVPSNPALPTLFLIGDSTVRNGRGDGANGQWGWGEPLVDHFDTSKINVVNRAVGGLSSRTFVNQGHWDRVKAMLKPGDFVMMQFGHNDNGPFDDKDRARGTIKGVSDETKEIDNPITKQHEVVHSYGWYLRKFIDEARAAGATPIMCTLIPRKTWRDGRIVRNSADYAGWAREVAVAAKVPVIDLNERIAARYDELGPEKVEPMFGDPHTHTSRAGAELNADIVVEGLKALQPNPLAAYLIEPSKAPKLTGMKAAVRELDNGRDIYMIADVHGDVERMLALIKAAKLFDGKQWTGGAVNLIFTGDMIDKGPRMVDTLRAILTLQQRAGTAGGTVIATLGNHEAEFLADPASKKFDAFAKELRAAGTSAADVSRGQGELGQFFQSLPVAARVDDWFFSHGGNTNGHNVSQINMDGFTAKALLDTNSILEARLGESGPGGKPWFDEAFPKRDAHQLLLDYTKALGVHHLVQGHQPKEVAFSDGVTRKTGEAFQRWGLLFLMDTGLSREIDTSTGAILHISQAMKTATVLCANGQSTLIWDAAAHSDLGHAPPCQ